MKIMGLLASGGRCLLTVVVIGQSLVARPPPVKYRFLIFIKR